MISNIIYVKNHKLSEEQANLALNSFLRFDWKATLVEGVTQKTLNEEDFPYANLEGSRFVDFYNQNRKKYLIKKSCLFNNLKFAQRVIEKDEPMIFLEHDSLAISECPDFDFDEYCFLSYEYAFNPPSVLSNLAHIRKYELRGNQGVNEFPEDYPLKYYHDSIYKGAIQTPGTAAYALTPKGAKKLLAAAKKGLEQSDYIINSHNLRLQYLWPSPIKYQPTNLNLSHSLE